MIAAQFLRNLIAAVRYAIHTVLTDNGVQFTDRTRDKYAFHHIFDRACDENAIGHRLIKIKHPWTNGQVERMNRTIKDATVKRFHYDDHAQLRSLLATFIDVQLWTTIKDPQRPHTIRIHMETLDKRAVPIHHRPNPSNAGTNTEWLLARSSTSEGPSKAQPCQGWDRGFVSFAALH